MRYILAALLLALCSTFAYAQSTQQLCYTTNGANCAPAIQSEGSKPINQASASTVEIVPLIANQTIFVTSWDVMAAGTGTFTLVYGTGTNCATGQAALTGAYPLIAQAGISKGNGLGPILVVPPGNALCGQASTSVQMSGSASYAQF